MVLKKEQLNKEKKEILKSAPCLGEIVRGTFIKVYLECIRKNCKCHKGKKYRHGPFYRISYGKDKRMHHIYVPLDWKEKARKWTENYNKWWEIVEKISEINIKLMKIKNGKRK